MRPLLPPSPRPFALGLLLTSACGVPSPANSTGTTTGETAAEEAGVDEGSGDGNGVESDEGGMDPMNPTQCEAEVAALAPFVSRPDGGCSVIVRVSHESLALLGYQTTCSATPEAPLDEEEARALTDCCAHQGTILEDPADPSLRVFYVAREGDAPGRVALVTNNVNARIFEASMGLGHAAGDIAFPNEWLEPEGLGFACGEVPMPPLASWDLTSDGAPPLPEERLREVWDVVGSTAIPFAMGAVGEPRHAAVLRYPRRFDAEGAFDPSTTEYLVLIEGGVGDDPDRMDAQGQ